MALLIAENAFYCNGSSCELNCWGYELFFPLEGPGSLRGGNQKNGGNYKIPLPGPTPESRESYRKITKFVFSE